MKKGHWCYIIIGLLIIWIIASYVSSPKSESNGSDSQSPSTSDTPGSSSAVVPGREGVDVDDMIAINSGDSMLVAPGSPAGPNKGILVSAEIPTTPSVSVANQPAGPIVSLGLVSIPVNGWVVVHENAEGKPGNILGAQRFDAGTYKGAQVELLRSTAVGSKYYVMLHSDDGDKIFDHVKDAGHIRNTSGQDVTANFVAQ